MSPEEAVDASKHTTMRFHADELAVLDELLLEKIKSFSSFSLDPPPDETPGERALRIEKEDAQFARRAIIRNLRIRMTQAQRRLRS